MAHSRAPLRAAEVPLPAPPAWRRSGRLGIGALLALLCCGCAATPQDAWWGPDKAAHLAVSAALAAGTTAVAMDAGHSPARAQAQALGVVLVVGVGKESYDRRSGSSGWSWRDMAWNLIGGLLGSTLVRVSD